MIKHYENRQSGYTHRYQIEFTWDDRGFFVMHCHEHPDDAHGKGVQHHHLYDSGQLCQRSGYESKTFEHAEAFAHWWMARYSTYIITGTFPMTKGRIQM